MFKPVYDFLGYSLNEVKYINEHKENTYISISVPNDFFDNDKNVYSLLICVSSDFAKEESRFVFQSSYKINDLPWFNSINLNQRKAIFFSIVFPFIREKILSITSDSNPGLAIPIIDVRNMNFEMELKLVKKEAPKVKTSI